MAHFSATWAPQCSQMNDVMTELAKDTQFSTVKFVKVILGVTQSLVQVYLTF